MPLSCRRQNHSTKKAAVPESPVLAASLPPKGGKKIFLSCNERVCVNMFAREDPAIGGENIHRAISVQHHSPASPMRMHSVFKLAAAHLLPIAAGCRLTAVPCPAALPLARYKTSRSCASSISPAWRSSDNKHGIGAAAALSGGSCASATCMRARRSGPATLDDARWEAVLAEYITPPHTLASCALVASLTGLLLSHAHPMKQFPLGIAFISVPAPIKGTARTPITCAAASSPISR